MSCLACLACQTGSCLLSCCGRTASIGSATLTRAAYFVLFLVTAVVAWVFEIWGNDIFGSSSIFNAFCRSSNTCANLMGPLAAYKVTFAFVVFHALFLLLLLGVKDATSGRGALHNGWWGPKILLWAGLVAGFLFLPPSFAHVYGWISVAGSVLFTVIQLFLLIDFAHTWNDSWVNKYHETGNKNWFRLLLGATLLLAALVLAATVLMYVFLLGDPVSCPYRTLNTVLVSVNLALCVTATVLAVLPKVQQHNPRASLLTASVVCTYATYLVWSALFSEPECSASFPSSAHPALKYASLVMGAIITFLAVAFSTVRAGSHADTASGEQSALLRRSAVNAGHDSDDGEVDDPEEARKREQEKHDRELLKLDEVDHDAHGETAVAYNYSWFHFVMLLGTMYVGCLMTNWAIVVVPTSTTPTPLHLSAAATTSPLLLAVDQSMISTWLKIASSWVVIALYVWTLLAPMIFPDRDFGFDQ